MTSKLFAYYQPSFVMFSFWSNFNINSFSGFQFIASAVYNQSNLPKILKSIWIFFDIGTLGQKSYRYFGASNEYFVIVKKFQQYIFLFMQEEYQRINTTTYQPVKASVTVGTQKDFSRECVACSDYSELVLKESIGGDLCIFII